MMSNTLSRLASSSASRTLANRLVARKSLNIPHCVQQKRYLSIHEYLSTKLLKSYGIPVPKGDVAKSGREAVKVARSIGSEDVVVKAQVLAGGRGKGHFENGFQGGVHIAYTTDEVASYADKMIGHKLITKQTGSKGRMCNSVLVVERKYSRREFYFAILMDRATQRPTILASSQGGMDIETLAKENPNAIITTSLDIHQGLTDDIAKNIARELGLSGHCIDEASEIFKKLYKLFKEKDATQIEINPLVETNNGEVMCMDAKLNFDDNAEYRQPGIFSLRDTTQEDPEEVEAAKSHLNFIKLDGNIGCLVNGAGLAMATMDIIKLNKGIPANFLDVGGGATSQTIHKAFELITSDSQVQAILVNIFGGIVRCDIIAQSLVDVVKNLNVKIPVVVRLQGTNMKQAQSIIANSGIKVFPVDDLQKAALKSVNLAHLVENARDMSIDIDIKSA